MNHPQQPPAKRASGNMDSAPEGQTRSRGSPNTPQPKNPPTSGESDNPNPSDFSAPRLAGKPSGRVIQKTSPKTPPNRKARPAYRPGLDEHKFPTSARSKRRRLPTLQELLDAFEPEDEYLEPEPEPGDFWAEPDDWPIE